MLSYYRTLFDIREKLDGQVGLKLLRDVEEILRTWVQDSFPSYPDILDEPDRSVTSGRQWENEGAQLHLSGGSVGDWGYFWLRWHVDSDIQAKSRSYLGFRLATEGESLQADVEIRVENRESGHFDSEWADILQTLLARYDCGTLGSTLSTDAHWVDSSEVEEFWEHISSPDRCLPVVIISQKRGRVMPLEGELLQRDLFGLAEVACCSDDVAWKLGWYSWQLLCYDGQVRIYAPGVRGDDDVFRHRSWNFDEVSNLQYEEVLQLIRDECSQRIYYPYGRDALRVFSRVRGRVRERHRAGLDQENRLLWDDLDEEISARNDEIKRQIAKYDSLQVDYERLQSEKEQREAYIRSLEYRLQSGDNRLSQGYSAPCIGGEEGPRSQIRTVSDAIDMAKEWKHVRVFERVGKDCEHMSRKDAKEFYDVLLLLSQCGERRPTNLGMAEEDWVRQSGISGYRGGESEATMNQYGDKRRFLDSDGTLLEMEPHIAIGKLRIHLRWSSAECQWLVGYFGEHLPVVTG